MTCVRVPANTKAAGREISTGLPALDVDGHLISIV